MSEGINHVLLAGNLADNAEFRVSQSGTNVLSFRVACTERYHDKKSNEWKDSTEWVSCVLFGARAEPLSKMMRKGASVTVLGKFKTESYEKNGEKRYSTKVYVNQVVLGGRGGAHADEQQGQPPQASSQQRQGNAKTQTPPAADFGYDPRDDVPF